jgi:hypothetical protein
MAIYGENGRYQIHPFHTSTSQLRHNLRRRIYLTAAKRFETSQ